MTLEIQAEQPQTRKGYRSLVGETAPVFSARSTNGEIALDQFRGKWVVLFFHPADFTPVEILEMTHFNNSEPWKYWKQCIDNER